MRAPAASLGLLLALSALRCAGNAAASPPRPRAQSCCLGPKSRAAAASCSWRGWEAPGRSKPRARPLCLLSSPSCPSHPFGAPGATGGAPRIPIFTQRGTRARGGLCVCVCVGMSWPSIGGPLSCCLDTCGAWRSSWPALSGLSVVPPAPGCLLSPASQTHPLPQVSPEGNLVIPLFAPWKLRSL